MQDPLELELELDQIEENQRAGDRLDRHVELEFHWED